MSEVMMNRILVKVETCLGESESSFRKGWYEFCLNRAYYAMFHSIQALLFTSGVQAKTYERSYSKFRELFIKTNLIDIELGLRLQKAFKKKQFNEFDYKEVLAEDAQESLEDATQFVNATIQYLKENKFLQ